MVIEFSIMELELIYLCLKLNSPDSDISLRISDMITYMYQNDIQNIELVL